MTKYYSRSKKEFIEIANMTDQYVRNAFVKMCKHEPTEDVMFAQQQRERADKLEVKLNSLTYQPYDNQGRVRDYQVEFTKLAKQRDKWKEKAMNMVEKDTYQAIFDKCQRLEKGLKEKTAELEFLRHHNKQDIKTIKTKTYATIDLAKENKKLKLENARLVDRLERDDHGIGEIERQRGRYL